MDLECVQTFAGLVLLMGIGSYLTKGARDFANVLRQVLLPLQILPNTYDLPYVVTDLHLVTLVIHESTNDQHKRVSMSTSRNHMSLQAC
jgi:hypothetical protein